VIPLVEYSFDRDDLLRRDAGRDDSRREERFDRRDYNEERRAYEEDLARERAEDRRAMDAEARARLEAALIPMTVEDLRRAVNDPSIRVTSGGRISSRRPSGRDVIRSSGQFANTGIPLPAKKPRKKNKKHCKNLSKCFEQANAELRKINGQLRKGKTQADIARRAHRLMKKCD
jgi:hypothetical protein